MAIEAALRRLNRHIAVVLSLVLLLAFGRTAAIAQTPVKQKVVVHLKHYTDNLHAVKMGVHLAYMMQKLGAEVTLLLDLEGVRLASTKEPQALVWGKGDPISKEYDAFVKAGGDVLLCPTAPSMLESQRATCGLAPVSGRMEPWRRQSWRRARSLIIERLGPLD
jgi:predicted peroxiredoxin